MRPDEHKKKKNADYKKKHGLPQNKTSKKSEVQNGKSTNSKEKLSKGETANLEASKERQPTLETTSSELHQETRRFSRRKITSNWDRYEDFDSSELNEDGMCTVQRRGEDFTKLLEEAGNSHSQFRFQDEKEWEDDLSNSQAIQSVLQLNFQELSESLKTLPLFKRLGLVSTDVRQDNEIMNDNTENPYDSLTGQTTPSILCKDLPGHAVQTILVDNSGQTNVPVRDIAGQTGQTISNVLPFPNQETAQPNCKLEFSLPGSQNDTAMQAVKSSAKTVLKKSTLDKDEELELLLSLDSSASNHQPRKQLSELAGKTSLTEDTGNISQAQAAPCPALKAEEDLEDWLDSVLG